MDNKVIISEMHLFNDRWYRVWNNGWIEQGGSLGNVPSGYTVTFSKPFKDKKYTYLVSGANSSMYVRSDSVTTTSMIIDANASGYRTYYACGF